MNTLYTFLGIFFIFFMTSLGASLVFYFKSGINGKLNIILLGFASGIMMAASVWSLLLPALSLSESYGSLKFLPALVGFLLGGIFLMVGSC